MLIFLVDILNTLIRECAALSCQSKEGCIFNGVIGTLVGLLILYILSIIAILIIVYRLNKRAVLCMIMLESAGAVCYFIGDNIKYISEVKSKCDINCRKKVGIASVALLGASLVVFLVIPLIYKKCKKMVMKGVKCCPCPTCDLNLGCLCTSTRDRSSEEEASRDESSEKERSGWYNVLEMFVIAVKMDAVYSIIEHASNIDVGDFCKENRLGLTITFLVILSLTGILLLFVHARYTCYKNFEDKCSQDITCVSVLMIITIPLYILEDNAQPLVCAHKAAKIAISCLILFLVIIVICLVIRYFCKKK